MQQIDQFNQATVDWQNPGIEITRDAAAAYNVSPAQIEAFQRDGVLLIKQAFVDWVEPLRAGLQRNLDEPAAYAFPCESNPEGNPGRFFDSYCNWQLIPEYLDFVTRSSAAAMAGQLMQSRHAQFFHDHAFIKTAGTQRATPWHQDLPYYCVDGFKSASVYVSLDQADAEVAVGFARGSHRWGKLFYPRIFEDGASFNQQDETSNMQTVPDIEANRSDYDIVAWSLQPGDAIVFDFRTLHGTGTAPVQKLRRAFSTRWLGDDMRYCERPGESSPSYRNHGMQHGENMREDWFPILWRGPGL